MHKQNKSPIKKILHDSNHSKQIFTPNKVKPQHYDILQMMLEDPLLKKMKDNLELQAQNNKRTQLLQNFPQRYRQLVRAEQQLIKAQEDLEREKQEQLQKFNKIYQQKQQIQKQLTKINQLLNVEKQKNQKQKQAYTKQIIQVKSIYEEINKQKDAKIDLLENQKEQLQKKILKCKIQKEGLAQFITQIKQQNEQLKSQINRMVENLTNKNVQIHILQQKIISIETGYRKSKQSFMDQIAFLQQQNISKLQEKQSKIKQLLNQNQKLNESIIEFNISKQKSKMQRQQMEVIQFNNIQDVRCKLLQQLQKYNQLQIQMERKQDEQADCERSLRTKINQLQEEILVLKYRIDEEKLKYKQQKQQIEINSNTRKDLEQQKANQFREQLSKWIIQREQLQTHIQILTLQKQKLNQIIKQLDQKQQDFQDKIFKLQKRLKYAEIIEQKIVKLRQTIDNMKNVVNQKDTKIQQLRQNILRYRKKQQQSQKIRLNTDKKQKQAKIINQQYCEKVKTLNLQIENYKARQKILLEEIRSLRKNTQTKTYCTQTQYKINEEVIKKQQQLKQQLQCSQQYLKKIQKLQQLSQKHQQKFNNMKEQFELKELQLKQIIQNKNRQIQQLVNINHVLRQSQQNETYLVQNVLQTNINELKHFYEGLLKQQSVRNNKLVQNLRKQLQQVHKYNEQRTKLSQQVKKHLQNLVIVQPKDLSQSIMS